MMAQAERIAADHQSTIYAFCLSFLRNPADAEDACQETFLAVVRHRDELDGVRDPRAWLLKVALRSCLWVRRKRRRDAHEPLVEGPAAPAPPPLHRDESGAVRAAIDRLPDRYRAVLALRFQQGLEHERIAEALDVSPEAARVLLHRAVVKLREEVRR